ncbi:hypothetical protein ACFC0D_33785 [Streptomyces sp. NPDC056222]|uniref:hypothetical protein n=1 Tax=Streptomyces sp. NPDC056222 TaxID=3345749 RepID=UPI0035DC268B
MCATDPRRLGCHRGRTAATARRGCCRSAIGIDQEWRVLLDAKAVPRGLSAATIEIRQDEDPLAIADLANELLALWDRPPIIRTVVEGDLGPVA